MSAPLTQYEQTGGITSLDHQDEFFRQAQLETDLTMAVAGHSVMGRPIYRVHVGNPQGIPIALLAVVHGNEEAPRESAMMYMRDLAYSTDQDTAEFLDAFSVTLVITLNPDGRAEDIRNNANGVDLNRDWFSLTQPETRVTASVLNDLGPVLVIDLHEWGTTSAPEFAFSYAVADVIDYPRHPAIESVMQHMLDTVLPDLDDAGYTTRPYPNSKPSIAQQHQTAASVPHHYLGFLVETSARAELPVRVESALLFLQLKQEWLMEQGENLLVATQESIADAQLGEQPAMIPSINPDGTPGPWEQVEIPDSYPIPAGFQVPGELMDLHGVEISSGEVSTHQRARGFIAALFDQRSYANIFDNPWEPTQQAYKVPASHGAAVMRDGIQYLAKRVYVQQGGITYAAKSIQQHKGGIVYPST